MGIDVATDFATDSAVEFVVFSETTVFVKFKISPPKVLLFGTTELARVRAIRLLFVVKEETGLGEDGIMPRRLSNSDSKFWATDVFPIKLGDCFSACELAAFRTSDSKPAPEK